MFKMRCGIPDAYILDITMYKMHVSFCSYFTIRILISKKNRNKLSRTAQGLHYRPCCRFYAYTLSFLLILFRISLNIPPWPTPSSTPVLLITITCHSFPKYSLTDTRQSVAKLVFVEQTMLHHLKTEISVRSKLLLLILVWKNLKQYRAPLVNTFQDGG